MLDLDDATTAALARDGCVRHGDLVLRPLAARGRVFYLVGDGLMPVEAGWIDPALRAATDWAVDSV